jgi:integrating conjugative element membrane protein (TIGR03747 family)
LLLSPLKLAFALGLGLVAVLLLAWSVDWLFVFKVWPQGIEHLRNLLADDLGHGVALAARQGSEAGAITAPANLLYSLVFEATGIHDMAVRFADGSALSIPDTIVRGSYVAHREVIETAMVGTQVVGVRLATLVRFSPLLLLLYGVGAADGLTQRAIRRACGGRESASLYHRAKYLQVALLGLGGVAMLVWPGSVAWERCATLVAVAAGGLARVQWAYYKKHL